MNKVEIWTGVTDPLQTEGLTLKDSATQLLTKYKSGTLVMQYSIQKIIQQPFVPED